jgi:trehalose-phosphatase
LVTDPEKTVDDLRRRAEEIDGLEIVEGKKIMELTDSPVSKGDALAALRRSLGVDRVVFMGDDVTDETAFAVLEDDDVGVHVGVGPTMATVAVANPSALADLLETIYEARAARSAAL